MNSSTDREPFVSKDTAGMPESTANIFNDYSKLAKNLSFVSKGLVADIPMVTHFGNCLISPLPPMKKSASSISSTVSLGFFGLIN